MADVNILLPLLVRHHEHHKLAVRWFESLAAGEAILCRFVQLALMRLLANPAVMRRHVVSAAEAWRLIAELLEDERIDFAAEPALLETVLPKLLRYSVPTGKLVGGAYLAAFSIAGRMRLTTVDKGFAQFRDVDLELLTP